VNYHKPTTPFELENLINSHQHLECECGVVSKCTVESVGRDLYDAQLSYWGEYKYSLEECIQWEYDLFILQTLKGSRMEYTCVQELQSILGEDYHVHHTDLYVDEELRVDLEVRRKNKILAGVQVKPSSYSNTREEVQYMNNKKNRKYPHPVFYVFYDYESETFSLDNLVVALRLWWLL
jgi:hypothetical protein